MFVREFGPVDAPVILALHPMGITGENLYEALAPYLTGSYRVIAPDQGGHGLSGHYSSFNDEVDTLKAGLKERNLDRFCLLFGASMGVDVAYELLKDPSLHFSKVWLDGAGLISDGPALEKYFSGVPTLRRPGYGHCAYMAGHTRDYVKEMESFINA